MLEIFVIQQLKTREIPTGIILLDRNLDGGIPKGSLVCVYAHPLAMPEVFLYHFSSVTKSFYFNTSRPAKYIKEDMERNSISSENVTFVDVFTQYYLNEFGQFVVEDKYRDKEIFDFLNESMEKICDKNKDFVLVVDSVSFFLSLNVEWSIKEWLLNKLYILSKENDTVVYAYLIKDLHSEDIVRRVLNISDVVIDISFERAGERIINKFAIPKIRGKKPILDYFRFYVDEGVQIDTAKDIA
ncbi:MAG: RAD55 family ATPase [Archaeoglobaceae archaeon]